MDPEQDQFDQVRRLLVLKRYEQPPPGYFDGFSRQVIVRIKAGDTGEAPTLFARVFGEIRWATRLWNAIEVRPGLAGALGFAACGVVLAGFLLSEPDPSGMIMTGTTDSVFHLGSGAHAAVAMPHPVQLTDLSATNGLLTRQIRDSLFDQVQRPSAHLVNSLAPAGY